MVRVMLTKFMPLLKDLAEEKEGSALDFFRWMKRALSIASTEAIYRPGNPFNKQPDLEDAFWGV